MLAVCADEQTVAHALAFEAALAAALAGAALIPAPAADRIAQACRSLQVDPEELAREAAHAGTLAIPLVARLRAALADHPDAAAAVHRGATSQDLADTVLMLQAQEAAALLEGDVGRIRSALTELARRTIAQPALGRTLLQDALPITFGLRAAQWLAGVAAAHCGFEAARAGIALQFGGAVGTRAGLDGKGEAIADHLARTLGLPAPRAPWHSDRTRIAALGAALGILIGAIGKIARDVSLLAQTSIGEAREAAVQGRGGSSAMAHKRNPVGCQIALSAAIRAPGLVSTLLAAMPGELERGIGGWQAEAPVLAELFLLAAGSADAMATVLEGLEMDEPAIARNLAGSGLGTDTGEAAAITAALLAEYGGGC